VGQYVCVGCIALISISSEMKGKKMRLFDTEGTGWQNCDPQSAGRGSYRSYLDLIDASAHIVVSRSD
jgi:hypothetical protein